ncbi:hypothetical protein TNCV_4411861 [Trichonephila clavipes]|nr:hypothetical protein TNCV_4411861 [Trichonephila clavipes]
MQKAASERELLVLHPTKNKIVECGISVDGTWQRRVTIGPAEKHDIAVPYHDRSTSMLYVWKETITIIHLCKCLQNRTPNLSWGKCRGFSSDHITSFTYQSTRFCDCEALSVEMTFCINICDK